MHGEWHRSSSSVWHPLGWTALLLALRLHRVQQGKLATGPVLLPRAAPPPACCPALLLGT